MSSIAPFGGRTISLSELKNRLLDRISELTDRVKKAEGQRLIEAKNELTIASRRLVHLKERMKNQE